MKTGEREERGWIEMGAASRIIRTIGQSLKTESERDVETNPSPQASITITMHHKSQLTTRNSQVTITISQRRTIR
jgi:hypothetical protein